MFFLKGFIVDISSLDKVFKKLFFKKVYLQICPGFISLSEEQPTERWQWWWRRHQIYTKSILVSIKDKSYFLKITIYFFVQGAFTNRWKKFHFYNYSPVFEVMHNMTLPFMKKKIRDRVSFRTYCVLFYQYIFICPFVHVCDGVQNSKTIEGKSKNLKEYWI